jgi:hypothetical protein
MEKLLGILVWPGVTLVLGVIALFLFRQQLAVLISRTKRVGKDGLETFESQPAPPTEEKKSVEEFFRTFDNPLLLEVEQLILKDLKDRKIEAAPDREKALVRSLASTNLILHFERVHGLIWASQLTSLRYLNPRDEGADRSELVPIYDAAKADYPERYENYPFERWLGFLKDANLIRERDSRVFITVQGREFLKYLIASGKSGPYYG